MACGMNHAVITGAIVRSKRLSADAFTRAQESTRRAGEDIRRRFAEQAPLPLELFRGDHWQILVTPPAGALRIALYLRAYLRADAGVDTRFAIGVGPIDAMPDQERCNRARGGVSSLRRHARLEDHREHALRRGRTDSR